MKPIAIINEKGGTAKTTTAVNLSAALAQLGQKVLLLDLDGQAAASRWLGVEEDNRLAEAILAGGGLVPLATRVPNLFLAPGSGKLDSISHELRPTQGGQLRRVLAALDGQFDYVLMDCPPSLGNRLIGNALLAARGAIVPVETSILALDGLRILLTVLDDVRKGFDHDIELLGVLPCRYDSRTRLSRLVVAELERALPGKVFHTRIREAVRIRECPAVSQTIFEYAPDCHAADDYQNLARELLAGQTLAASIPHAEGDLTVDHELTPDERRAVADFRAHASQWFQPGQSADDPTPDSPPTPDVSASVIPQTPPDCGPGDSLPSSSPETLPLDSSPIDLPSPTPAADVPAPLAPECPPAEETPSPLSATDTAPSADQPARPESAPASLLSQQPAPFPAPLPDYGPVDSHPVPTGPLQKSFLRPEDLADADDPVVFDPAADEPPPMPPPTARSSRHRWLVPAVGSFVVVLAVSTVVAVKFLKPTPAPASATTPTVAAPNPKPARAIPAPVDRGPVSSLPNKPATPTAPAVAIAPSTPVAPPARTDQTPPGTVRGDSLPSTPVIPSVPVVPIAPVPLVAQAAPPTPESQPAPPPSKVSIVHAEPEYIAPPADLVLSGIMTGGSGLAVINGKILEPGQSIAKAKILAINETSVEMERNGRRFTLRLGVTPTSK